MSAAPPASVDPAKKPIPNWIWADKTAERQTVGFRTTFTLPDDKTAIDTAALWMTCDNEVTAFVNGKKVANNPIWQVPVRAEIARELKPGKNVIAFLAKNENAQAGFIAKMQIVLRGDTKLTSPAMKTGASLKRCPKAGGPSISTTRPGRRRT